MEKIIYRNDFEVALKKIEADLTDLYRSPGVYTLTALGAHLQNALSSVSSAVCYINQFEEK